MIALEGAACEPEGTGEAVQLVEALVACEVRPQLRDPGIVRAPGRRDVRCMPPPPPDRGVDEDGHGWIR